jgi:hypothetical protein
LAARQVGWPQSPKCKTTARESATVQMPNSRNCLHAVAVLWGGPPGPRGTPPSRSSPAESSAPHRREAGRGAGCGRGRPPHGKSMWHWVANPQCKRSSPPRETNRLRKIGAAHPLWWQPGCSAGQADGPPRGHAAIWPCENLRRLATGAPPPLLTSQVRAL